MSRRDTDQNQRSQGENSFATKMIDHLGHPGPEQNRLEHHCPHQNADIRFTAAILGNKEREKKKTTQAHDNKEVGNPQNKKLTTIQCRHLFLYGLIEIGSFQMGLT